MVKMFCLVAQAGEISHRADTYINKDFLYFLIGAGENILFFLDGPEK